jgi:hypothetical protein
MTARQRRAPRRIDEVPEEERAAYIAESTPVKWPGTRLKDKLDRIRMTVDGDMAYMYPAATLTKIKMILDEEG